jgi:hypothetical protein
MTVQIDRSRTAVYEPMGHKVTCIACKLKKGVCRCPFEGVKGPQPPKAA